MFFKVLRKHANRISMLIATAAVLCALLWNEGGENFNKSPDSAPGAAQIMILGGDPLVRIESTDEAYGTIFQEVIVQRLSAQNAGNRMFSECIHAILKLLLAAVTAMLLHRLVHIWLHRNQKGIVCYIHDQDGKK